MTDPEEKIKALEELKTYLLNYISSTTDGEFNINRAINDFYKMKNADDITYEEVITKKRVKYEYDKQDYATTSESMISQLQSEVNELMSSEIRNTIVTTQELAGNKQNINLPAIEVAPFPSFPVQPQTLPELRVMSAIKIAEHKIQINQLISEMEKTINPKDHNKLRKEVTALRMEINRLNEVVELNIDRTFTGNVSRCRNEKRKFKIYLNIIIKTKALNAKIELYNSMPEGNKKKNLLQEIQYDKNELKTHFYKMGGNDSHGYGEYYRELFKWSNTNKLDEFKTIDFRDKSEDHSQVNFNEDIITDKLKNLNIDGLKDSPLRLYKKFEAKSEDQIILAYHNTLSQLREKLLQQLNTSPNDKQRAQLIVVNQLIQEIITSNQLIRSTYEKNEIISKHLNELTQFKNDLKLFYTELTSREVKDKAEVKILDDNTSIKHISTNNDGIWELKIGDDKYILRAEKEAVKNSDLVSYLSTTPCSKYMTKTYANFHVTENSRRITVEEYINGKNLADTYTELHRNNNKEIDSIQDCCIADFSQIFDFLIKIESENGYYNDIKLPNFIKDDDGQIFISDMKSIISTTNGKIKGGSGISFQFTRGHEPPEFTSENCLNPNYEFDADKMSAYQAGLELYVSLTGLKLIDKDDTNTKIDDNQLLNSYKNTGFDYNHPSFKGEKGEKLKTLCQGLLESDPDKRMSLRQAQKQLNNVKQSKKNEHATDPSPTLRKEISPSGKDKEKMNYAYSLDYDGCIAAGSIDEILEQNEDLIQEIVDKVKAGHKVTLFVGSNRQNIQKDHLNSNKDSGKTPSVYAAFAAIEQKVKERINNSELENNINFNHLLAVDLYNNREPGTTYEKYMKDDSYIKSGYPPEESDLPYVERFKEDTIFEDETKVSTLYAQMQLFSEKNKGKPCEFVFMDDRADILDKLSYYFSNHPELIPNSVTLKLEQKISKENRESIIEKYIEQSAKFVNKGVNESDSLKQITGGLVRTRAITGTGAYNSNFLETSKQLAVSENKKVDEVNNPVGHITAEINNLIFETSEDTQLKEELTKIIGNLQLNYLKEQSKNQGGFKEEIEALSTLHLAITGQYVDLTPHLEALSKGQIGKELTQHLEKSNNHKFKNSKGKNITTIKGLVSKFDKKGIVQNNKKTMLEQLKEECEVKKSEIETKNHYAYSLDYDGCIREKTIEDIISKNDKLIDEIVDKINQGHKVTLFIGSNRQAISKDYSNSKPRSKNMTDDNKIGYPSVFNAMPKIEEEIKKRVGLEKADNIEFNKFLAADLHINGRKPGNSFEIYNKDIDYVKDNKIPQENDQKVQEMIKNESRFLLDETKISTVYAQMQQLALNNEDKSIEFVFIDDNGEILNGLYHYFLQHPDLIPTNTTLRLEQKLSSEQIKEAEDYHTNTNDENYINLPNEIKWRYTLQSVCNEIVSPRQIVGEGKANVDYVAKAIELANKAQQNDCNKCGEIGIEIQELSKNRGHISDELTCYRQYRDKAIVLDSYIKDYLHNNNIVLSDKESEAVNEINKLFRGEENNAQDYESVLTGKNLKPCFDGLFKTTKLGMYSHYSGKDIASLNDLITVLNQRVRNQGVFMTKKKALTFPQILSI